MNARVRGHATALSQILDTLCYHSKNCCARTALCVLCVLCGSIYLMLKLLSFMINELRLYTGYKTLSILS